MRKPKPEPAPLTPESPRLSRDLLGPKHPERCQHCGGTEGLTRQRECDHNNKPEHIYVVLCAKCEKKFVKKHPRLYIELQPFEPAPGCMPLCVDCAHRDGTTCRHPDSAPSGGRGMALRYPKQSAPMHLYFGGGKGRWIRFYTGPVTGCRGREERSFQDYEDAEGTN